MNIDGFQIGNSTSLSESSSDSDKLEILFLDTFSSTANLDNDNLNEDVTKKEPNIGLVQFSYPVVIHEIRIIPLSTIVTADRAAQLGATNPSSFDIHFYLNDLKAKESSTFSDIGCFSYKERENYVFKPSVLVATDGLFLRGNFESITLALLGEVTDLSSLLSKESTASKLSNDIKDYERDENSNINLVDIKEPDDTQDYIESQNDSNKNDFYASRHVDNSTTTKCEHLVQDVHSLSPSPENIARILSPSPKSHSNSSRENQRLKKNKDYDYDNTKKYSSSRSSSISPNNNYSLKSRISLPSSTVRSHSSSSSSKRRSSTERERDELNSSSHHYRDQHYDYKCFSQYGFKRSKERSTELSSSRSHYYNKYNHHSRSRSKESDDHYRSSNHHHSHRHEHDHRHASSRSSETKRQRRRSSSLEKNHDNRSIHSRDSRDDNRSICSLRVRNVGAGGHRGYDYSDNSRDLSPKSPSKQHRVYQTTSTSSSVVAGRSRRSISPEHEHEHRSRKRGYPHVGSSSHHHHHHHHRDSHSSRADSIDKSINTLTASPDRKKSRYNIINIASSTSASPVSLHYNNKIGNNNKIYASPDSLQASSKEIESIASPVSPNDEDSLIMLKDEHNPFSPPLSQQQQTRQPMSPHSSISNESLDQFDCDFRNEPNDTLLNDESNDDNLSKNDDSSKVTTEFFEPLSDNDELLLENKNDDNFEQISTSSDVDNVDINDEQTKMSNSNDQKAELEIISSDEEYADDLNAALASDKVEYAKNYLDISGEKYDDDELDNAFDMNQRLFNPFVQNRLNPLKFPFNSNRTTSFIDLKLFNSIMKFVNDNFSDLYKEDSFDNRKNSIDSNWVKNLEKLSNIIMQLSCPIYYSFNEDENLIHSEQDIERLIPMLIMIAKDGLNYDLAMAQKIPFKVRHLKAGIKLIIALFSSFDIRSKENDEKLLKRLFVEDLPYDLLLLYNKPFMTLSLRLLILNGLIVICDHADGVEYLCEKHFDWSRTLRPEMAEFIKHSDENQTRPVILSDDLMFNATCYQYLLQIILSHQNTRLTSVFEELLDKINLFELFKTFSTMSQSEWNQTHQCNIQVNSESSNNLHAILSQMTTYFDRLSNRIHRPLRLLPNICQYEIKTAVHSSIPLLLLLTSDSILDNVPNNDQFEYIHERFHCKQTYCSSSKIGFFSQKSFYRFFKHFDLFSSLIELLKFLKKCPTTMENNAHRDYLCDKVLKLLDMITSHQQGLKFLLEDQKNVDYVNSIHSILIDFSNINHDDQLKNKCINFGIKFITRLYTFNLIDKILYHIYAYQRENLNKTSTNPSAILVDPSNNTSVIDSLLRLCMMIHFEKAMLRDMVISVITMEHNFDAIYSFIIPITSQFDPKNSLTSEKIFNWDSTSFIYATKIAIACVQYLPEKNLLHFYETYGKSLLKNSENVQTFVQNSLVKLHRSDIFQSHILKYSTLMNWISPLKNEKFNDELIIRKFVTILKKHHDAFQDKFKSVDNYIDRVFFIEPEIVTIIKTLVALCDPMANYNKNLDPDIQLKYKYSLVQCYRFDCVSYLLTLLEAVTETCERPSHQTFAYTFNDSYLTLFVKNYLKTSTGNSNSNNSSNSQPKLHSLQQLNNSILHQGTLVIEFIRPSVRFLKLILEYLLSSVGHKFNDSTPIPIFLKLYHLLTHFPSTMNSETYGQIELTTKTLAKSIQQQIIDIILTVYTAVYVEHSDSEESLRKSVWTKMLKHVFEFILLEPKYFESGLEIISRILPTPLPLLVNKPLNESESIFIINYRKLWSAHLHCINDDIENVINCLVLSNSVHVQTLLRIVCHKMCDLYSATVLTVTKTITEFFVHTIGDVLQAKLNERTSMTRFNGKYYCNNCTKIIDFILDLFASSLSFRIGILNAFYCFANSDSSTKESKIYKFFHKMFEYLNRKKFDHNFNVSSYIFLKDIFYDENKDELQDETIDSISILEQYFDTADDNISTLKTFKFSDKLTSKFVVACSQSLNQYFNDRTIFIICSTNGQQVENKTTVKEEEMDTSEEQIDPDSIYSHQFSKLSDKFKMPDVWNSQLSNNRTNELDLKKVDLIELCKKYLNVDADGLVKILSNHYLPIVELPETQDKPSEDVTKLSNMNPQPKRTTLRGRGRLYGHRGDPFRSRPPNTSRPPSMHVDDFVAMEQRSDPLAGLVNKNRSNHLLHVNTNVSHSTSNSSSYSGKHSDYIRKKNFSTHHNIHSHSHMASSPYHSNYSNTIKSNMLNNSGSNSSHFSNKQS